VPQNRLILIIVLGHQFHAVVAPLDALETQQQPLDSTGNFI
jgi:hypothetical protein